MFDHLKVRGTWENVNRVLHFQQICLSFTLLLDIEHGSEFVLGHIVAKKVLE